MLWLGQARELSAAASCRLGNFTFGKLPILKNPWEVSDLDKVFVNVP